MSTIVIMPGGFHPFHAGHFALYQSAKKAFPGADLYVAATNDMSERPFPFQLKEKLAKLAGVEPGHFVQVKSPFQAKEITQNYDPDQDVLVFVRSEKDRTEQPKPGGTKKDGTPAYFQPWTGKNLQPFSKHAYMAYLPTVEFGPGITSATQIRKAWPTLNDKRKLAMVMSLYPAAQKNPKLAQNVVGMFDQVMGGQQGVAEGSENNRISFQVQKGKNKFATTLSIGNNPVGVYQYDANTGRSIAEVYPEFKGKGLGKLLVLHAIYTAAKLGLDFQEDESRTSEYDNVLDSLSSNGYIVDDDGYWYVTGEGEQFLKQSLKQGVAEGSESDAYGNTGEKHECGSCDGTGMVSYDELAKAVEYDDVCPECGGKGWVRDKESLKKKGVAEGKESDPVTDAVISFYKPVVNDIHKEKVDNYVDQARELLQKTNDPSVRSKLIDIFKKGKENPYMQGGIVTTVGALLAGGVLSTAQNMGLSPAQTNLALQAILNTVIPTVVSRINGKNWSDTIKYTLASAGIGTGIAGAGLIEDDMPESMDYLEEK